MVPPREWLLDAFRYDLWANRQWLPLVDDDLAGVGHAESNDDIPTEPKARIADTFVHILHGQRIWLERLGVSVASSGEAWLPDLHEAWVGVLRGRDPAETIRYPSAYAGRDVERTVGDLAWNILNHGTYHRGQMRETADLAGIDWPETDVTRWRVTEEQPSTVHRR